MAAAADYSTRELRNAVDPAQPESLTIAAPIDPATVIETAGGDAIVLCEALIAAAASDKYRRNSALTSFVRAYLNSQNEIKEVQRRLDLRAAQRISESNTTTLKA